MYIDRLRPARFPEVPYEVRGRHKILHFHMPHENGRQLSQFSPSTIAYKLHSSF
jgi:hypothetical protein